MTRDYAEYVREWKKTRVVESEGSKICPGCKEDKPLVDFYVHRGGKYGRAHKCKSCANIDAHYLNIKRLYGLDAETYDRMIAHGCYICGANGAYGYGRKRRLSVDHCHDTNIVRGVLCDLCNFMLGNARNDASLLRRAAEYLEATIK